MEKLKEHYKDTVCNLVAHILFGISYDFSSDSDNYKLSTLLTTSKPLSSTLTTPLSLDKKLDKINEFSKILKKKYMMNVKSFLESINKNINNKEEIIEMLNSP